MTSGGVTPGKAADAGLPVRHAGIEQLGGSSPGRLAPPGEQSNQFRPLVAVHVSVRGERSAPGGWPRHVIVVDSS